MNLVYSNELHVHYGTRMNMNINKIHINLYRVMHASLMEDKC